MTRDLDWLESTLRAVDRIFWRDELEAIGVTIRWMRFRRVTRSFRFAAYWPTCHVIEVNPVLASAWIPDIVVAYTIYHESIHAIQAPEPETHSSRYKHDLAFKQAEARYPHAAECEIWQTENIGKLIAARPPFGVK